MKAANSLTHKGYLGSIEASLEDGCLHGRVLFINDLVTYEGETILELNRAFADAVDRYLDYCERTGKPANKSFSGSFNVRTGEARHRALAARATELGCNINEAVCRAIDQWLVPAGAQETHNHLHLHVEGLSEMATLVSSTGAAQNYKVMTNVRH